MTAPYDRTLNSERDGVPANQAPMPSTPPSSPPPAYPPAQAAPTPVVSGPVTGGQPTAGPTLVSTPAATVGSGGWGQPVGVNGAGRTDPVSSNGVVTPAGAPVAGVPMAGGVASPAPAGAGLPNPAGAGAAALGGGVGLPNGVGLPSGDGLPNSGASAVLGAPVGGVPGQQLSGQQLSVQQRSGRLTHIAFGMALLLVVTTVVQTVLLVRLNEQVDDQARQFAAFQRQAEERITQLEEQTAALNERAQRTLDSVAVADVALPSVFRVTAGNAGGTAFAVAGAGELDSGQVYLLTNFHVVESWVAAGEDVVQLERGDRSFQATIVATDPDADLALLEAEEEVATLPVATESPAPGEPVVVIGAPGGLEDTVTTGVVSTIRSLPGSDVEFIQFDAAINPGNSGGPVINARGEVIGVATAKIAEAEGIGFAVPIYVACEVFSIC